jgi:hypothetical protein
MSLHPRMINPLCLIKEEDYSLNLTPILIGHCEKIYAYFFPDITNETTLIREKLTVKK